MRLPATLLLMLGTFLACGGMLGLGAASKEWDAYKVASASTRTLPLRELLKDGAAGNSHVVATDFTVAGRFIGNQPISADHPMTVLCLLPADPAPGKQGAL